MSHYDEAGKKGIVTEIHVVVHQRIKRTMLPVFCTCKVFMETFPRKVRVNKMKVKTWKIYTTFIMADRLGGVGRNHIRARQVRPR